MNTQGNMLAGMTREERAAYDDAVKASKPAVSGKHVSEMTGAELTTFERSIGIRPSHQDMAERRRNGGK